MSEGELQLNRALADRAFAGQQGCLQEREPVRYRPFALWRRDSSSHLEMSMKGNGGSGPPSTSLRLNASSIRVRSSLGVPPAFTQSLTSPCSASSGKETTVSLGTMPRR